MDSILKAIQRKLQTAAGNIAGNVSAIVNPQTRSTWFRGFTPQNQYAQQFTAGAVSEAVPFVTQRFGESLAPTARTIPLKVARGAGQFAGMIPSFIAAGAITAPLRAAKGLKLLSKIPAVGKFAAGTAREAILGGGFGAIRALAEGKPQNIREQAISSALGFAPFGAAGQVRKLVPRMAALAGGSALAEAIKEKGLTKQALQTGLMTAPFALMGGGVKPKGGAKAILKAEAKKISPKNLSQQLLESLRKPQVKGGVGIPKELQSLAQKGRGGVKPTYSQTLFISPKGKHIGKSLGLENITHQDLGIGSMEQTGNIRIRDRFDVLNIEVHTKPTILQLEEINKLVKNKMDTKFYVNPDKPIIWDIYSKKGNLRISNTGQYEGFVKQLTDFYTQATKGVGIPKGLAVWYREPTGTGNFRLIRKGVFNNIDEAKTYINQERQAGASWKLYQIRDVEGKVIPGIKPVLNRAGNIITQATKGVGIPKGLESLAQEARKYKSAEELLSKNYGITKIENAHNAAWVSPSGKLTGNLADHQESAVSTLRKLGFSPSDEYNAVQQLQKETGTIRFHMSEHEINVDVASKITPEQLRTIQKVVKKYPDLGFVFEIKNPQTGKVIKSGTNLTDFTQGVKSQLTDFYTQATKGVAPQVKGGVGIPKGLVKGIKPEAKVGSLVKLESGRIDKVIKIIPETGWDYKKYVTQELNPPQGQKPRIAKVAYEKRSDGTRAFELLQDFRERISTPPLSPEIPKAKAIKGQKVIINAFGGLRLPVKIVDVEGDKMSVKFLINNALGSVGDVRRIGTYYIASANPKDVSNYINAAKKGLPAPEFITPPLSPIGEMPLVQAQKPPVTVSRGVVGETFQKDLDRFTALVKQNDKYQQGVPAIGKLPSSQQVAEQLGIAHDELMDQVLTKAGKPVLQRLPAKPIEAIPSLKPQLPLTPEGAIPTGMKERGVMKTIRTAEVTTPELKQGVEAITGESRYYKPYSDIPALKNAQSLIAKEGIDSVKNIILKGKYNKTNVAAAEILISKAINEGRIEEAATLLKDLSIKATTSGQANQAWSMWSRITPEGMLKYAVKEVMNANEKMGVVTKFIRARLGKKAPEITAEDATIITDLMKKANSAATDIEKAKYVKLALQTISDKIPLGVSEVFDAFRYNNMLSGLPTHEKNFYQNVLNTFATPPLTLVAEGRPLQAVKYEIGAIKAIPKGLDNFVKSMRREIPLDLSKVEIGREVRLKKLPRPITVFSELMESADKLFSTIIESAEIGIGKTPAEAKAIAEEYLLRTPIGTKGKGILSDNVDSMAQGIEAFGRKFKPVRWAVPFLRTPFNFAKMWLEYSPVGAINLIGNVNKRNVLAKAILGSVATTIGAKVALEGRTTWAVPSDKETKDWFYATKRKPFSIKIGDNWIPAQYFGPFAFAILLPAAANYYYNEAPKALTDGDMGKLGKTLASVLYFWSQSSPMSNLGGFVKTMEGDIDFSISKNVAFTLSQLKPYEGMLRYIANIFDPVYRKPATFGEQMISDIPFLKETIPDYYKEPTGEPSVKEPINFLLPYGIGISKPEYELYYQGRSAELRKNAMETELKNAFEEGKPLPPNASIDMKANLLHSELKKAIANQDVEAINKIKASGIATPDVKEKVKAYHTLEKYGIMKADRELMEFEGEARAAETLKRLKTFVPKNRYKHLQLLIKANIVTPEILEEIKRLTQQEKK